jgi:membrane protease YdiL (CAAX protease family)
MIAAFREPHMSDFEIQPSPQPSPAPQRYAPPQRCGYCQAPLNAFFYFCTGCGMPYKDVTTVLSPEIPRQLSEGELIRMKAPSVWPMFWTYVGVLTVCLIMGLSGSFDQRPELGMLFQMGMLFATTCVFAAMYWTSLSTQLLRLGFFSWEAWFAIGFLVPMLGINYLYHEMLVEMARELPQFKPPVSIKTVLTDPVFRVVSFAVFPAVIEEVAFRGLIQHWLQTALKPWRAIVLASFLFAILHFNVLSLPYLFGVGMLLGWTKWKTNSLYPSMLIHFLHNLVVVEWMN